MEPETCNAALCPYVAGAIGFVCGAALTSVVCKLRCAKKDGRRSAGHRGDGRGPYQNRPQQRPSAKIHPAPPAGSIEIYVGNLHYDMTEDELKNAFAAYGKVDDARIITNRFNGRSKGFGFVHMSEMKEVEAAVAALDDKEFRGRRIKCNVAKPEERKS